MTQEEKENQLILELCREVGDSGDAEEMIDGFRGNYPSDVITAAASGDVQALVELRRGCGLPIFS